MLKQADSAKPPMRRGEPCVLPGKSETKFWPLRSSRDWSCTTTAYLTGTPRLLRNEGFFEPPQRSFAPSAQPSALLY